MESPRKKRIAEILPPETIKVMTWQGKRLFLWHAMSWLGRTAVCRRDSDLEERLFLEDVQSVRKELARLGLFRIHCVNLSTARRDPLWEYEFPTQVL